MLTSYYLFKLKIVQVITRLLNKQWLEKSFTFNLLNNVLYIFTSSIFV